MHVCMHVWYVRMHAYICMLCMYIYLRVVQESDTASIKHTFVLDHYQTELECENFNATQLLYNGAKVIVLEAIAQFFEWFT